MGLDPAKSGSGFDIDAVSSDNTEDLPTVSTEAHSEVAEDLLLGHPLGGEQLGDCNRHLLLPAQHRRHAGPVADAVLLQAGHQAWGGGERALAA